MAERFLIDTSAVIKYLNEVFPQPGMKFLDEVLNIESSISFISEIELQVWDPSNPKDIKIYLSFLEQSNILGIDQDIVQETIKILKSGKIKLPDALIAATAIVHERTLLADNDRDYKQVAGLKYISPAHLA